jgi:hypothetical protein
MIFDAIRESHDLQRDLCRKLTASRRDMAARQLLFLQLKVELMAHAVAEERLQATAFGNVVIDRFRPSSGHSTIGLISRVLDSWYRARLSRPTVLGL